MKIFVCFSGEYEQRCANAAFTSKEIAEQYSDDVEEFELWDRLPLKIRVFEACGVFGDQVADSFHWKQDGEWTVKRDSFMADEYFLQWWAGEEIKYWGLPSAPGIYVEVKGGSREEVDKRFTELQAEVKGGRKP